jgi:Uma2 family endonuclease
MSTVEVQQTPQDLLTMPDGDRYELVEGRLVDRDMGFQSGRVAGRLFQFMANHSDSTNAGWVLPSNVGYQCFPDDPTKVRKPDVSFIRRERLTADQEPEGHATLAPDLAVEVVSPNDVFENVSEKVREYLNAGVRLVWVVDPVGREVHVHRPDGPGSILRAEDELAGGEVLPGFRCRVGDLFKPPVGPV